MSKSFNMAGWRVGFCCGNREMVKALATIKGYYDYGHFAPIWIASVIAMRDCAAVPAQQSRIYQKRRDVLCRSLDRLGVDIRIAACRHVRLGKDQAPNTLRGRTRSISACA